ncbi:hydrogenase [Eisenbergiella tayi]|uniref:NADP-reducing hydrogenase subunit HndC n=1 Tax=Eisenbergiella tayi TaxID=1432052 RepID=A0A1E3ALK3_9FIRM|nr:NADH-dependent [FeFe] hydrogenase, group A6 [Eisenbergiella tayi]ODM09610.1 NADP-reducing hydrogenase subunit HndC [Eisenbergiella tayi]OIZ63364.1 hydrogenase [Eisenbergiella tayi]
MVTLTIDNKKISVPEGTTIMKAAASVGIMIPHLCYLEGINEISACKVCVVEMQGKTKLITACNNPVEEGMVLYTNSPKARAVRRTNVELILSQHNSNCATCVRSGNCNLQKLSNDLGIIDIPYKKEIMEMPWNRDFPLIRDFGKCIKCMRCVQICDKVQDLHIWDVQNTGSRTTVDVSQNRIIEESDCSICGQCITHCPTGALRERDDTSKIFRALADPETITVVQVAPAVRAAWGEALDMPAYMATEGRMVAALKKIGFDYVFDTNFSADLTIMEEGNELLARLADPEEKRWPMFTSCCPAWVRFMKSQYPEMADHLSTAKSPQQMFGAITKSYFAEKTGVDPKKICSISIMPCVSKKMEAVLPDMYSAGAGADVDIVLTTREFARLVRAEHIAPALLTEEAFDSPLGESTGAGVIFGVTGGVMEAALRTAYYCVEGVNPPPDTFSDVRGFEGRKEASFTLGGKKLRTCTVSGLKNARDLMEDIRSGAVHYDFVEVMACPGGCVGGGGQPILDGVEMADVRGPKLYKLDSQRPLRFSHDNPEIIKLYEEYLEKPLGEKSHHLLHTHG